MILELLQAATPTVPTEPGFYDDGFGRFLVSPGFGGLAALIGGGLAYAAALRKSKDDRDKAADDRDKARDDREAALAQLHLAQQRAADDSEHTRQERWWSRLSWVYERVTEEREEARMSALLAFDLLAQLEDQAHTDLERQAVESLLGIFSDERTGPRGG